METFRIQPPSPLLASYIKHFWILETDCTTQESERIIPCGNIQMLFYRGDPVVLSSLEQTERVQDCALLCGQSVGYSDIRLTGRIKIIAVVFHVHGASAFFRMPMFELGERKVVFADTEDRPLVDLQDQILEASDDASAIRLIEQFLLRRLHPLKDYNLQRMEAVISKIGLMKGETSLADLYEAACLSPKQFRRVFTAHIGINPKDFLRIIRFQHALFVLQSSPDLLFSRLAYECGYSDQSHLIHEFKTFSGYTPKEYLSVCPPYSDYFKEE